MPESPDHDQYGDRSMQSETVAKVAPAAKDLSEETSDGSVDGSHSHSNSIHSVRGHGAIEGIASGVFEKESPPPTGKPEPELKWTVTNVSNTEPYSAFTKNQKRFIVFMASWAGFFSPVSGQIYFPALNDLAADLNVSNTLINLTLTSYMLAQGAAPTLIGDLADTMGRRLAYAVCFIIYIAANIGLALQNSYAALFVLRILQSAGSSGTIAMASGVVSDIATASERGKYMGYTLAGSLLGPAIGPVLGGVLSEFLGWRSIFWFLLIMGAAFLVIFAIFFPETARNQVGDGSIPPKGYNMSLMNYLAVRKARKQQQYLNLTPTQSTTSLPAQKFRFPNPLTSLIVLNDKENALLLSYNAFIFAAFYDVSAVIPSQFALIYNFNSLHIGLCFIPFGLGSLLAALVNGPLLDGNFARWCRKLNVPIKKGRQTDLRHFPIEKARLQIAIPAAYIAIVLVLGFGWTLHYSGPLALQLVILFFASFAMSLAFSVTFTLLIDFYPNSSATATAANNLVRCWVGAGATAAVIPMVESWGRGWTFTALVAWLLATSPMLWGVYWWGMGWREERRVKEDEKMKARTKEENMGPAGEEGGAEGREVVTSANVKS